jgi:hypothetical protein
VAEVRESYLVRIASDPPARIWSGVGNLEIPADIVEPEPAIYLGRGELVRVPDFQQLINGVAERLEFTLSGVNAETLRFALEDAPSVAGAAVHVGRIDFDVDWQPIGPVEWEALFRADSLRVDSQTADGRRVRALILSIGNGDTGRSYSPTSFFTDADQRLRSPTDAFFSNIGNIYSGTSRRFGPAS